MIFQNPYSSLNPKMKIKDMFYKLYDVYLEALKNTTDNCVALEINKLIMFFIVILLFL